MKKIISAFILILGSICFGQIPGDIPSYAEEIFYIDYSSDPGGDGSYENPWKDISDIPSTYYSTEWPRLGWDYSKAAILFKRNVTMWGDAPRGAELRVEADSVYVGSYGEGAMAMLLFDSNTRGLRINGRGNVISHLHIHNLDTITFSVALAVGGPQGTSRQGIALIDSVEISRGYRGLTLGNMQRADVVNTVIHTVNHDAVYISGSDSVTFNKLHSYGINRDWMWDRAGTVSGGDIIQAEGVSGDRIRYLEIDSSFLDYSMFGGKYAIISNQTDTTIVRNSIFIGHPITQSALRGANYLFENNEVYGFSHALWTVGGVSVVRNSLFVGYGEDFTFEGVALDTPYLRGNFQDFYNNVVMYADRIYEFPSQNINSRNNVYYDVNQVFYTGVRSYHGSRDIHWRTDGNQNSFTGYDELYPEIISDPLFVDPVIERTHHIEIEGAGDGAWSWFEITKFPDLRLQINSPGIGAADPRVWDTEATFTFGENATNNWGESGDGDAVFDRKFSEFYISYVDKDGRTRPGGEYFDIGAYEYSMTEVTISGLLAENKEYDGTTDASIDDWGTLEGIEEGDDVALVTVAHRSRFSSKAAGAGKTVTVSGLSLEGDDANRYFINHQTTTADIIPKELTITGSFEVADKTYNGSRNAVITDNQLELTGVITGDDVVIDEIVAEFVQADVGEDIVVNLVSAGAGGFDSKNYSVSVDGSPTTTASITRRDATITADDKTKVYGSADPEFTVVYSGLAPGEDASVFGGSLSVTREQGEDAGSYDITPSGLASNNYNITYEQGILTITVKELGIGGTFTAEDKPWDGTTTAVMKDDLLTLVGVVGTDDVILADVEIEFARADAGNDIDVYIVNASLEGDDAGNYTLTLDGAPTSTASILEIVEYTFTVTIEGEGSVEVNEEAYTDVITVEEGAALTLEAIADEGWEFDGWSGDLVSDNVVETVTMDSNKTITAVFTFVSGIVPVTADEILIYPNPFDNHIIIENARFAERIYISSLTGQTVMVVQLTGNEREVLRTESLARGVYLLIIENADGERKTVRMIKE